MKKEAGILLIFCTACGAQGDLGKARFHVGQSWENHAKVAVGSQFDLEANHGLFSERLTLESQDTALLTIDGNTGKALSAGSISIEAHDTDDGLIDIFNLELIDASTLALRDPSEPNAYWSESLPERFAIVEDSHSELYIAMLDESSTPLYHDNTVRVLGDDNWVVSMGHYGSELRLHSRQEGESIIQIESNKGLEQQYIVEVIDRNDIASMTVRLSPNVESIPKLNEPLDISSRFNSMVYVAVDARSRDNVPVLLPEGSVSVVGDEEANITMGSTGFWVRSQYNEAVSVQIEIGNMRGFAYIN